MPWSLSLQTRATVGELLQVLGSSPPKPSLLPRLGRLSLASTQTSLEKRWKDEHQGALSCGGQAWTTILKPQRSPPPNQGSFQRVSFPRGGNIPERKGSPLEQNSEEEEKEKKPLWLPGPLSLTLAHGNFDHWPPALSSPASGSGSPTWTRPVTLALFFFSARSVEGLGHSGSLPQHSVFVRNTWWFPQVAAAAGQLWFQHVGDVANSPGGQHVVRRAGKRFLAAVVSRRRFQNEWRTNPCVSTPCSPGKTL